MTRSSSEATVALAFSACCSAVCSLADMLAERARARQEEVA